MAMARVQQDDRELSRQRFLRAGATNSLAASAHPRMR
jgi:hypothetical protein